MKPEWQARFSEKIIAVSDSTKNDLINRYQINPSKIKVIYSGVSLKRPSEEEILKFKKEKKLPEKFILFLGTIEPRKNINGIIRAFSILKSKSGFNELKLVIAGSQGWLQEKITGEDIIFTGKIDEEEKALFYSAASVFVYPSFFEGFGLPPLEAMVCGTPVVVSRNSSLPEVVGDAGILIDPYNPSDIANAIKEILTDAQLAKKLTKNGFIRSSQFSWQKTAEKTLEVLVK